MALDHPWPLDAGLETGQVSGYRLIGINEEFPDVFGNCNSLLRSGDTAPNALW